MDAHNTIAAKSSLSPRRFNDQKSHLIMYNTRVPVSQSLVTDPARYGVV